MRTIFEKIAIAVLGMDAIFAAIICLFALIGTIVFIFQYYEKKTLSSIWKATGFGILTLCCCIAICICIYPSIIGEAFFI